MALTYDSTEDKWSDSITIAQQTGTILTLATNDQYVNGDIEFTIGVTGGSASIPTVDSANVITSNPTITYGTNKITVSHSANKNITPAVSPGWVAAGTQGTISTSGSTDYSSLSFPSATTSFSITNAGTISVTNNGTFSLTNNTNGIMTITNNSTKTTNAITNAGSIKTITNNASKTISTITNKGTITTLTNSGTITSLNNTGTITSLGNASGKTIATLTNKGTITTLNNTGTVTVKSTTTSGTVKVNAYPASGSTLDGEKTIVSGGRWQCTPTFNGAGTYYGKVTVSAGTITFTAGSITNTDADLSTQTNITASPSENNSGVAITCRGYAGCSSATYTNTAGWFTAHSSATNAGGAVTQTNWTGTTYYVNGVTLQAPSSSTHTFNLTVPNGNSTDITLTFTVDSSGNVVVT